MNLSDFKIVRGANRTEECYMGDLDRIDLSADLMLRRNDTRLMGVDVAWLQEAVAEREHVIGRTSDIAASRVGTFDRRLLGEPIEFMTKAVADYLKKGNCFTWTADFTDWTELSADASVEMWLVEIAEREGKRVTSLAIPVPEFDSRVIRADRILALQRGMRELGIAIVTAGHPANVTAETVEVDGTLDESESVTIVGTRTLYSEYAKASKTGGKWKTDGRVTRTAKLGALDSIAITFPSEKYNGAFILKRATTWICVLVTYHTNNVGERHQYAVRVGASTFTVPGIDKATVQNVIEGVNRRHHFNMDPATVEHSEHAVISDVYMSISIVKKAEVVCEFRDAVTDV